MHISRGEKVGAAISLNVNSSEDHLRLSVNQSGDSRSYGCARRRNGSIGDNANGKSIGIARNRTAHVEPSTRRNIGNRQCRKRSRRAIGSGVG